MDPPRPHRRSSTAVHSFEWQPQEVVWRVVLEALSERTGTPLRELPPLAGAVDPESLVELLQRGSGTTRGSQSVVSFVFADHRVVLSSIGFGSLYDAT